MNTKKILLIFCCSINLFAAIPEKDQPAPDPNYKQHFPTTEEQKEDGRLIEKDELHQDKIKGILGYENDVGESSIEQRIDETGRTYYFDKKTGKEYESPKYKQSEEYNESLSKIGKKDKSLSEEDQLKEELANLRKAKSDMKKENESLGNTPKKLENMTIGMSPTALGTSVVNESFLKKIDSENEEEQNTNKYYRDNFGYDSINLSKQKAATSNAGKIKKSYEVIEFVEERERLKHEAKQITCAITRDLIPAYFCPINGKQNTLFGGDPKSNEGVEKKKCNNNCSVPKSCVPNKILDKVEIKTEIEKEIYPSKAEKTFSIPVDDRMAVEYIKFQIEITPSDKFKGSTEDFDKFIRSAGFKFKTSVVRSEESKGNLSNMVVDRMKTTIRSNLMEIEIPLGNSIMETLNVLFYNLYIEEGFNSLDLIKHKEKFDNIKDIKAKNITVKYASDSLFYCPHKQLVDNANQCIGGLDSIKTIQNGSQFLKLCMDTEHRIGPETTTGGFYTNESCSNSCTEETDCLPTYKKYTDVGNKDFKASIVCADVEGNQACTVEKCKNLIAQEENGEIMPVNEFVVENDDIKRQTVLNKMINGNLTRPKFSLNDELNMAASSDPSYDLLFQAEMKDAAYKYMVTEGTYNRVEYRIGTPSPKKHSYMTETIDDKQKILLNLKPNSYDVDNGKPYYLYIVMELETLYKPLAGLFIIDNQEIQANRNKQNDLQFVDKTYLVKTPEEWKVFKKKEFSNKKQNFDIMRCEDGTLREEPMGFFDNKILASGCTVSKYTKFPDTPGMLKEYDVFYNPSNDSFSNYDANSTPASYFQVAPFSSSVVENNYLISNDIGYDIAEAPGAVIRDQASLNNDQSFRKIYIGSYGDMYNRSYVKNYKLYEVYSDTPLSYKALYTALTEENAFYEKINANKYSKKIKHDGEINNNIKVFILGNTNKTTVNTEIEPYVEEHGQKVFKFLFLHDDEEIINPLKK